jgi:ethanolamine ammonia-lyase small subunit
MSERPPNLPGRWPQLRTYTPARVGLGKTGVSLPTARHLEFQLAHSLARDAVYTRLEADALAAALAARGHPVLRVHSAAADRATYLRRPDLGRALDAASRSALEAVRAPSAGIVFAVADGLSATAVNFYAVDTIVATLSEAHARDRATARIVLVEQGRVAIGDEIGEILGAEIVVVLIGERPGLSAHDSMGAYVTWSPRAGTADAARNCISNVRDEGLPFSEAGQQIAALVAAARLHRCTGIALSSALAASGLEAARVKTSSIEDERMSEGKLTLES